MSRLFLVLACLTGSIRLSQCGWGLPSEKDILKDNVRMNTLYRSSMCHEILKLPCDHHRHVVCGSNNVEFRNHCKFAQARCKDENMSLLNKGHCQLLTSPGVVQSQGTKSPATTKPPGVTTPPATTKPSGVTGTTVAAVDPTFDLVTDVFCSHAASIVCDNPFDAEQICDTNSHLYDNICEFTKAKCLNPDTEISSPLRGLCN